MRILIGGIAVAVLVGCTTTALQERPPALAEHSSKTPQQFARCLAPKWQAINSSTSSYETEQGYGITATATFTGVVALAVIKTQPDGSSVEIFLPSDWAGTRGWKRSAQSCL